jgi:integrase/recombinase XerD
MTLTIQTGLRVSELIALRCQDAHLASAAHPGHRQGPQTAHHPADHAHHRRPAPLDQRARRPPRPAAVPDQPRTGAQPRRRRPARQQARHDREPQLPDAGHQDRLAARAAPHRRDAGVDASVIALWLGHESTDATQIDLHADIAIKERALARTTPTGVKPGRYRPTDALLAFLEQL